MTEPSADTLALLAPLVIGVTGHRDLRPEDHDELKKQIRHILKELQNLYRHTPIILLSPLAEGADRLAAEVALEVGARLVVPLPMPQHLYEQDFESPDSPPDSLKEFHRLLAHTRHRIPPPVPTEEDKKTFAHPKAARNWQYEAMGKYIARESQILIALWDGIDSGRVGGTAEIVRFQLEGIPCPSECNLQPQELFPVYHILTPRLSNPHPKGRPYRLLKKYPKSKEDPKNEKAKAYYEQIFRNLEEFNKEIVNGGASLTAKAAASKRDLLCNSELLCKFDEAALSPIQSLDLGRYAVADALAQRFQSKMQWIDRLLHVFVLGGFVCFVCFAHLESHHWFLLAAFLGLLAIPYSKVMYLPQAEVTIGNARGPDSKSQDYRAIAEGSRVRFFWHLARVRKSVADNYLGKQRTELDWIRNGLRGWELGSHMAPPPARPPDKEVLEKVQELWIEGQIDYFARSAKRMEKKLERMEGWKSFFFLLSFSIALGTLLALFIVLRYDGINDTLREFYLSRLIIATDVSLVSAGLLHHYIQQRAYPQHIKQFGRMESVFGKAREIIQQKLEAHDLTGVQECLFVVGQEALSENGDWVLLHRERPLEPPPP
jgi:hypothetical protein